MRLFQQSGAALLVLTVILLSPLESSEFIPLGDLLGGETNGQALAVNQTGSVAVGVSAGVKSGLAFRWTENVGMIAIARSGAAQAVSNDGYVIVGQIINPISGQTEPFRWTPLFGVQSLGAIDSTLPAPPSFAFDVSGDGKIVVGRTNAASRAVAYRWTVNAGFEALETPSFNKSSAATAISEDGSVITGNSITEDIQQAFRWTRETGLIGLGVLPGDNATTSASGISADGSVIVGNSTISTVNQPFRWTDTSGMVGLGFLDSPLRSSIAQATTGKGEAIVGTSLGFAGSSNDAFLWTESLGMVRLQVILESHFGLAGQLDGWDLSTAADISSDGRSIVGQALSPAGDSVAYLIRLDRPVFVPEPTAFALMLVAMSIGVLLMRNPRLAANVGDK